MNNKINNFLFYCREKLKNFILNKENIVLLLMPLIFLIINLLTSCRDIYGYYIDEFYYIACSKKLAFGYVDHPPLSILILAIWRFLFGDSLLSLRLLPAIIGSSTIIITIFMVRKLEGKIFSQILASLLLMAIPVFWGATGFFSMNSFEILIWSVCIYLLIIIIKENKQKLWILFGVMAGIGLQNKHTILIFGASIFIALLFTKERKSFLNKWIWIGGLFAFIIFLPNLIWQVINDWPTIEFYKNASANKYLHNPPHLVLLNLIMFYNPALFPIWTIGIIYLFIIDNGKYRIFGLSFIFLLLFLIITKSSRSDRILGIYPILFVSTSIFFERIFSRDKMDAYSCNCFYNNKFFTNFSFCCSRITSKNCLPIFVIFGYN